MPTTDQLSAYAADPQRFLDDLILPTGRGEKRFGDCMAAFQRQRFAALTPDLLAVAQNLKPAIGSHWWEASKGASKDSDLAASMLWLLAFTRRPVLVQVGAADSEQAAELRKAAADILHANPWLAKEIQAFKREIVCEATSSKVEIVSADAASAHGARPDVLIVNELHAIRDPEFAANLMDNSEKVPWGLRIVATNAGFCGSWQYRWRELYRENPEWYFHRFAEPAPWLSPKRLAEAQRRNSPSRYARLFLGEWVSGGGDALDQADVQACVTLDGPIFAAADGFAFIGGLDLSVKRDHSALVILATQPGSGSVRLAWAQSWRPGADGRVDLMRVESEIRYADERFGGLYWLGFDPFQAALLAERLSRDGIPTQEVTFNPTNCTRMARDLLEVFRGRKIQLYEDERLLSDLFRLRIVERGFGYKLESTSDESGHCDIATALAIALPAALEVAHTVMAPVEDENAVYRVIC